MVVCSVALSVDFKPNSELASWLELVRFVPYPAYLLAALGAACLSLVLGWQWYSQGEYLVASRYPLRDCATGAIPYRGRKHTYVQQSYARCTVVVDDTEIDLVTAHFLSPRDGLNSTRHDWFNGLWPHGWTVMRTA